MALPSTNPNNAYQTAQTPQLETVVHYVLTHLCQAATLQGSILLRFSIGEKYIICACSTKFHQEHMHTHTHTGNTLSHLIRLEGLDILLSNLKDTIKSGTVHCLYCFFLRQKKDRNRERPIEMQGCWINSKELNSMNLFFFFFSWRIKWLTHVLYISLIEGHLG